jgi:hypothetical protein
MSRSPRCTAVVFVLVVFVSGLAASPAAAQSQREIDWCTNLTHEFSPDQQIGGCTAAIQSDSLGGHGLAWAFNDRGFAYYLKRDLDSAFADFEQAIQLDPKNAVAFNNRGSIAPSPITTRRSGSIPLMSLPSIIAGTLTSTRTIMTAP